MRLAKLYITGGPASGKTTLSRSLAATLEVPVHEMDGVLLSHEGREEPFEATSNRAVSRITAEDSWVVEGSYLGWVDPLLRQADLVVWMYVPWRVASYRIIFRHVKATVARNNRFPGWRNLYRFWRWSGKFYKSQNPSGLNPWGVPDTRATMIEYLTPYKDKLVACQINKGVEQVMARISAASLQE